MYVIGVCVLDNPPRNAKNVQVPNVYGVSLVI